MGACRSPSVRRSCHLASETYQTTSSYILCRDFWGRRLDLQRTMSRYPLPPEWKRVLGLCRESRADCPILQSNRETPASLFQHSDYVGCNRQANNRELYPNVIRLIPPVKNHKRTAYFSREPGPRF